MEMNVLRGRVERGIIFLDSKEGAEWPVRINLGRLDIGFPGTCIVGQLRGNFIDGLADLDISLNQAERMGFYLYPGESDYYDDLTEAWRERLARMPEVQQAEEK